MIGVFLFLKRHKLRNKAKEGDFFISLFKNTSKNSTNRGNQKNFVLNVTVDDLLIHLTLVVNRRETVFFQLFCIGGVLFMSGN